MEDSASLSPLSFLSNATGSTNDLDGRRWVGIKAKEKCLRKLAKRRHIVPGQQAQRKREFIPRRGDNHRESSTLFKRCMCWDLKISGL